MIRTNRWYCCFAVVAFALIITAWEQDGCAQTPGVTISNGDDAPSLTVVRSGDGIEPARMLSPEDLQSSCPYPPEAYRAHEEGATKIRVATDSTGALISSSVLVSSGFSQLDSAALACIKKARFAPATRNGEPIEFVGEVIWRWRLPAMLKTCEQPHISANTEEMTGVTSVVTLKPAPDAAHRASGGGSATVCVCLDDSGKVVNDPLISASSGSAFFDSGAINVAKSMHYNPGRPGCTRMKIVFKE
jgi:TonB family protein